VNRVKKKDMRGERMIIRRSGFSSRGPRVDSAAAASSRERARRDSICLIFRTREKGNCERLVAGSRMESSKRRAHFLRIDCRLGGGGSNHASRGVHTRGFRNSGDRGRIAGSSGTTRFVICSRRFSQQSENVQSAMATSVAMARLNRSRPRQPRNLDRRRENRARRAPAAFLRCGLLLRIA
jgi:hypothetical protein